MMTFYTAATILKEAALLWYDKDADLMAASVSYYAIFAAAPLLLLSVSVSGLLFGRDYVADLLVAWGSLLGADLLQLLQEAVQNLESLSVDFTLPFIGVLFFSGMTVVMLNTITTNIHTLWNVAPNGVRGWVRKCVHAIGFIIVLELYLVLLIGFYRFIATAVINTLGDVFADTLAFLGSVIITTVLFVLLFTILPKRRLPLSANLTGALVASILFTAVKGLVALYITITPVPQLFGTAGLVIVFLIWTFVSVAVIYYGATIAYVLTQKQGLQKI